VVKSAGRSITGGIIILNPKFDGSQPLARVAFKELSQAMVEAFKGRIDM